MEDVVLQVFFRRRALARCRANNQTHNGEQSTNKRGSEQEAGDDDVNGLYALIGERGFALANTEKRPHYGDDRLKEARSLFHQSILERWRRT
jgi:hypothetical protein